MAIGVFLLAGGAGALNQFQERKYDVLMPRTKHRVLPQKKLTPMEALLISSIAIILGFLSLYFFCGIIPALLGLFNLVWYNIVYTNLKIITPFAVVPGSLTGAVPAFIGWTAAGGYILDVDIIFIGGFLFIWQIPHFWLLLLKYDDEYSKAGFPSIHKTLSKESLKHIIYIWIFASSLVSFMYLLFSSNHSSILLISILILNVWLIITFAKLSFSKMIELNFKRAFVSINVYMIIFLAVLVIYNIFS